MREEGTIKAAKYGSIAIVVFLTAGLLAFPAHADTASTQAPSALSNNDCAKCHAEEAKDLTEAGAGHLQPNCLGCHTDHPPKVAKPIPLCGKCHLKSRNDHFDLQMPDCLKCHTNPHRPLNISLTDAGNGACHGCHEPEVRMFGQFKSKHQALECSHCHDVHRKIPQCTQCHKPHKAEVAAADCNNCHYGHMPKVEVFPAGMSSTVCVSCHQTPADLLRATTSKHKILACTGCHSLKHKYKPDCKECHRAPHPENMLAKFPKCGMCHYSAHDPNKWPEAAGEAPKQQK